MKKYERLILNFVEYAGDPIRTSENQNDTIFDGKDFLN
jgi:hypothetical protein